MIYLDHNASAPLRPDALAAMQPFLLGAGANASSLHRLGRDAKEAIKQARAHVAGLIGAADADAIVFTSGGTESDVWALRGVFTDDVGDRDELVVSAVEHPAVMETAVALAAAGRARVRRATVDGRGRLLPLVLGERTRLVSVMAANNETGNVYDIRHVVAAARDVGAAVHCDAVQAAGRAPVAVDDWGVDLCSISAHKIGGPQGVGALYVRPGFPLAPLITGGGQEGGMRSGTSNVAGIVGFGAAAAAVVADSAAPARMAALRDRFEARILDRIADVVVVGDLAHRLPNTSLLSIRGVKGEAVVFDLDAHGVAISTGSACSSGNGRVSHVVEAMSLPELDRDAVVRVSVGPETDPSSVDEAAATLEAAVRRLRNLASGGSGV